MGNTTSSVVVGHGGCVPELSLSLPSRFVYHDHANCAVAKLSEHVYRAAQKVYVYQSRAAALVAMREMERVCNEPAVFWRADDVWHTEPVPLYAAELTIQRENARLRKEGEKQLDASANKIIQRENSRGHSTELLTTRSLLRQSSAELAEVERALDREKSKYCKVANDLNETKRLLVQDLEKANELGLRVKELEAKNKAAEKHAQSQEKYRASRQAKINKLHAECKHFEQSIKDLEEAEEEVRGRVQDLEAAEEEARGRVQDLEARAAKADMQATQSLKDRSANVKTLGAAVKALKEELPQLQREKKTAQQDVDAIRKLRASAADELSELRAEQDALHGEVSRLRAEREELVRESAMRSEEWSEEGGLVARKTEELAMLEKTELRLRERLVRLTSATAREKRRAEQHAANLAIMKEIQTVDLPSATAKTTPRVDGAASTVSS